MVAEYPASGHLQELGSKAARGETLDWRPLVEAAVAALEGDSSPGYPLMRLARTNEELLGTHKELVVGLAVARLQRLQGSDVAQLRRLTAGSLVEQGYTDEVRLFVKNELHSELKVQQGRMRLIASISVVDQIVERVLNGPQNRAEIDMWESIPSKPGMGLHDEGLESLRRQLDGLGKIPVSSDVSGFDWSVPQWMLDWDAKVRAQLCAAGPLSHMFEARAVCLGLSRFVFSDGEVWDQITPGIQKSGSYNTSSTNSRLRVLLAWLCGVSYGYEGRCIAMGDDAVENAPVSPEDLIDAYATFGFTLKEVARGDLEFCAYRFGKDGSLEPIRWHKMLASVLATSVRDEAHERDLLAALEYELRHSRHRERAFGIIRASGWGARK